MGINVGGGETFFNVQEVEVFLLTFTSVLEVVCCQVSQCLEFSKSPGSKRAAAFVIPVVFFGKSYIVPGSSVVCSVVLCHSALMLQGFLLQLQYFYEHFSCII